MKVTISNIREFVDTLQKQKPTKNPMFILFCTYCKYVHVLNKKTSKKCFPEFRKLL